MIKEEDREAWVGDNRFYFGEDKILYVTIDGKLDVNTAVAMHEVFLKVLGSVNGKIDIFVDNSKSGKPSAEARKMFTKMIESEKIGKIAVV